MIRTKLKEYRAKYNMTQEDLAQRVGVRDAVVLTGGVGQNSGVADAIQKELGQRILVARDPQLTGALGAALLAYEEQMRKEKSA